MIDLKETAIVVIATGESVYRVLDQIPTVGDTIMIDCSNNAIDKDKLASCVDMVVEGYGDNKTPHDAINHAIWNATTKETIIFVPAGASGMIKDTITDLLIEGRANSIATKNGIILVNTPRKTIESSYFDKTVPFKYMLSCYMALLEADHNLTINGFIRMNAAESNFIVSYKKKIEEQSKSDSKVTFIIPSKTNTRQEQAIKAEYTGPEILALTVGPKTMCKKLHKAISSASGERIVILAQDSNLPGQQLRAMTDTLGDTMIISNGSTPSAVAFDKCSYKMFNQTPTINFEMIVARIKDSTKPTGIKKTVASGIEAAKKRAEKIEMDVIRDKRPVTSKPTGKKAYVVVIPYMANGDRFPLLEKSVDALKAAMGQVGLEYKIVIHEIGSSRSLTSAFIEESGVDHIFTEWDDVFHRGWALNVGAKYATKPKDKDITFVFMDGDIVVTKEWATELKHTNKPCVGWGVLHNLTKGDTDKYLSGEIKTKSLSQLKYERTRTPAIQAAAGGITIIPKRVFDQVKGFPENFKGTWGGNDNSMMHKLDKFGYRFSMMPVTAYHLHHEHQTKRVQSIKSKWKEIKKWGKSEWETELASITEWGVGKTVTVAMINFRREEKLIRTLNTLADMTDIQLRLCLQVQNSENIPDEVAERIEQAASRFHDPQIVWTDGNLGTAIPRWNTTMSAMETDSNYVLILDSDMIVERNTVERLLEEIEKRPEYGAISCWCLPNYNVWDIKNGKLVHRKPQPGFNDTAALGTGCVIVRAGVFEEAQFNQELFIGFIDFLWCMEVTEAGWKLGILAEQNYRILNDRKGDSKSYKTDRNNRAEIERSRKYFQEKWGLKV